MGDGEKLLTHLNSALKVLLGLDIFLRLPKKKLNFVDQCYRPGRGNFSPKCPHRSEAHLAYPVVKRMGSDGDHSPPQPALRVRMHAAIPLLPHSTAQGQLHL